MSEKLKALTDKIYQEGIEKAKEDSKRIIDDAKAKAKSIKEEAEQARESLISNTKAEMASYRRKVEAEIKLSAQKSANKIKQALRQIITEKVITERVENQLSSDEAIQQILIACVSSLKKMDDGTWRINLSTKDEKMIIQWLAIEKAELLAKKVEIKPNPSLKNGFELHPEGANYTLRFNDETFVEFIGEYLKLETKNLLVD